MFGIYKKPFPQILDFELSPEEMKAIESLDRGEKGREFTFGHISGYQLFSNMSDF